MREGDVVKVTLQADDIALAFILERRLYEQGWESAFRDEIIGVYERQLKRDDLPG